MAAASSGRSGCARARFAITSSRPRKTCARTLTRIAHVPEHKIEVVHHGFDLDRLDPRNADPARVRRELGLEGKLVFGAIGRLYALKNYAALLQAFASALAEVREARLVIVGAGRREPAHGAGPRLSESPTGSCSCGPRNDMPDVLAAFDVFVHPAIAESFGMVIVEAMAMARPVLSTPVGIAPEVIASSRNRTAVPVFRAETRWLEASGRCSRCARRGPTMGAAAHGASQGFTATSMASRYQELYAQWLGEA